MEQFCQPHKEITKVMRVKKGRGRMEGVYVINEIGGEGGAGWYFNKSVFRGVAVGR